MSRDLTAGMVSAAAAANLSPIMFYEGEFSGGTLRLWTGHHNITWSGEIWTGAGHLLGVSEVAETADLRAAGITLSLSGMPSALISTVLAQARLNKPGRVWFGVMEADGTVRADPFLAFAGKLDVPSWEDTGDTCTISVTYESDLIALSIPRARRYTHEDQQLRDPGDLGFQYVATLPDQVLEW